jgi:hypothetical protein
MNEAWERARALAAVSSRRVPAEIRGALLRWLKDDARSDYETDRLHYGADLWRGKCERAIWYGLHGTPRDPETLGSQLRYKGGRIFEAAIGSALLHAGLEVRAQVAVRPLRPSAWAWAPGHADLVVVPWRKLIEVKAPRAAFFYQARGDHRMLVREAHRWQASAYFHELRRRGEVDTASFLFLDREGSNEPIEVELDEELLVPLDAIVAEEERKARLVTLTEPPDRVRGSIVIEVLKGGRATRQTPAPERVVRATAHLSWQCSYCPFRSSCQPDPDERPLELTQELRARAVEEAERRWAAGAKRVRLTAGDDTEAGAPWLLRSDGQRR